MGKNQRRSLTKYKVKSQVDLGQILVQGLGWDDDSTSVVGFVQRVIINWFLYNTTGS